MELVRTAETDDTFTSLDATTVVATDATQVATTDAAQVAAEEVPTEEQPAAEA